jgi:hypothetical protein
VYVDSTVCRAHQHAAGGIEKGDLQKEQSSTSGCTKPPPSCPPYTPSTMKRRVQFTEQAGRFRDYLPADDRKKLLHVVDQIANDPQGPDTHLAYRDDDATRSTWADGLMVHYLVTPSDVVIVEVDVYDTSRGFNIV